MHPQGRKKKFHTRVRSRRFVAAEIDLHALRIAACLLPASDRWKPNLCPTLPSKDSYAARLSDGVSHASARNSMDQVTHLVVENY